MGVKFDFSGVTVPLLTQWLVSSAPEASAPQEASASPTEARQALEQISTAWQARFEDLAATRDTYQAARNLLDGFQSDAARAANTENSRAKKLNALLLNLDDEAAAHLLSKKNNFVGDLPIHTAINRDHAKLAKTMAQKTSAKDLAYANMTLDPKKTRGIALRQAITRSHYDLAEIILDRMEAKDIGGASLKEAVSKGNIALAEKIVAKARAEDLGKKLAVEYEPCKGSVLNNVITRTEPGYESLAMKLIEKIPSGDFVGTTYQKHPLTVAINSRREALVEQILAKITAKALGQISKGGQLPISAAMSEGDFVLADKILTKMRAKDLAVSSSSVGTPLQHAISLGNRDFARKILEKMRVEDLGLNSSALGLPVHHALSNDMPELALEILEKMDTNSLSKGSYSGENSTKLLKLAFKKINIDFVEKVLQVLSELESPVEYIQAVKMIQKKYSGYLRRALSVDNPAFVFKACMALLQAADMKNTKLNPEQRIELTEGQKAIIQTKLGETRDLALGDLVSVVGTTLDSAFRQEFLGALAA